VDVIPDESEQAEKRVELEAALIDENSNQSTSSEAEEVATSKCWGRGMFGEVTAHDTELYCVLLR